MDSAINIEWIVNSTRELDDVSEGLTKSSLGNTEEGDPVKIRAYATEEEAREKEDLLNALRDVIDTPEYLGRWRNCLVFRYLALEPGISPTDDRDFHYSIGCFLGSINNIQMDDDNAKSIEKEFSSWLERLTGMRLIPHWVMEEAEAFYQCNKPEELSICIDHWDAMPHNFGWSDGVFYLLDEKHLRPSYQGIGLIKPLFLLEHEEWQKLKAGYDSVSPTYQKINAHLDFLKFYYLVAALYFYSLASAAGRISLARNLRYLDYRERLIETVSGWGRFNQLRSEIHLYLTYPRDVPYLLRRRLSARRVLSETQ